MGTSCRAAYEKPAQALISQLDPQLRFCRSYTEIRPHAPHCRERVLRLDFEQMMRTAIQEARLSRSEGNEGYGAILVMGDRVVTRTHDTSYAGGAPGVRSTRQHGRPETWTCAVGCSL